MQIAFLGSRDSWYLRDLQRAAAGRYAITSVPFNEMSARVGGGDVVCSRETSLANADALLVRTMPPGSLEQVVFRMDALAQLETLGTRVINPAKAIEVAVDKHLASCRLAAAGLTIPRTVTCQSVDAALDAFEDLGRDVVLKPIFGGEGRGITRLTDPALAERAFRLLVPLGAVIHLQEFVEHDGADLRLFVTPQRVLGMRRANPLDWRTNISRGAKGQPFVVTDELAELAQRAARSVGAIIAGVDLLPGRDGTLYALEVNAVPGWRALAKTTDIDVAQIVLQTIESDCKQCV